MLFFERKGHRGGQRVQITVGKILALGVAITYGVIFVSTVVGEAPTTAAAVVKSCEGCAILLVIVSLIWFPEQIGAATGYIGHGVVNAESPPFLVSFMGWVFLLGLPVAVYFLR
jgi:hypothetical protein